MRWLILALFLLSSVGLIGCNTPRLVSAEEQQAGDDLPDLTPETDESSRLPSDSSSPPSLPESEGLLSTPDPLAEEPVEPTLLKAKQSPIWLFYYGYEKCQPCQIAKPKVQAWANKKGLTQSESDKPNARMCQVQYIDIVKTAPKRDLSFGGDQPLYPTYVWVDQHGNTLAYYVGKLDESQLEFTWNHAQRLAR